MKITAKFIGIIALMMTSFPCFAQETTVPLCGKIDVVTVELEKKLNLFTEYENFQQALLYKTSDNEYSLEVMYKSNNVLKTDKKPMTQTQLDAFCAKLNDSKKVEDILNLDQDGRTEFLISSTVSGLGFYGWAIPLAAGVENSRPAVATYMLVSGSSFFVPFFLTKDKDFSRPMARAYSIGTGTGIGHGFLIQGLMALNTQNSDNLQKQLFVPIALGLGESIGFTALTKKHDLSVSNVGMIATGATWGTAWGASTGLLLTSENSTNAENEVRKILISSLVGSGAGMYFGHVVHHKMPSMTNGDVIVTNAYGVLGALASATAVDLVLDFNDFNDAKIMVGSMTLASAGGLLYGLRRTSDYNYTTSEGAYIGLAEIAGGALGLGLGYLITDDLSSEVALVSTTIGASAGLLIIDNYLRKRSLKVNTSIGNFNFGFNPMGVANAFDNDNSVKSLEYYQRSTNNYIIRAGMTF